jgi:hypothetical protein
LRRRLAQTVWCCAPACREAAQRGASTYAGRCSPRRIRALAFVGLYSENIAETLAARDDAYRVIKCHAVDERGRDAIRQGNCRCIYTHRDPREAVTSTMKFAAVSFEAALGAIKGSLEFLSFQRQFGKLLCLAYAEITGAPRLAVRNIAEHLALDVDETAIAEADRLSGRAEAAAVIERIDSLPTTEVHRDNRYVYDRRSLLHRNHLTGVGAQWRTVLSDDQARLIEEETRPWADLLVSRGSPPDNNC